MPKIQIPTPSEVKTICSCVRFILGSFQVHFDSTIVLVSEVHIRFISYIYMRNEPNLNCLEAVQIRFILEAVPELTSLKSFKN